MKINWNSIKSFGMDKWILIIFAGMLLVVSSVPKGCNISKKDKSEEKIIIQNTDSYEKRTEKRLKKLIEKMDGVTDVDIMITLKSGGEKVILKQQPYSKKNIEEKDSSGGVRKTDEINQSEEVIYYKDENGDEKPYVIKENTPAIEGIVVIGCGLGESKKKSEVISAIEALFPISAHKISVIEKSK